MFGQVLFLVFPGTPHYYVDTVEPDFSILHPFIDDLRSQNIVLDGKQPVLNERERANGNELYEEDEQHIVSRAVIGIFLSANVTVANRRHSRSHKVHLVNVEIPWLFI